MPPSSARSAQSPPPLSRFHSASPTRSLTNDTKPSSKSGASGSGGGSSNPKRKAARNLLREYYGLQPGAAAGAKKGLDGDPMDIDSPAFDPQVYYNHLLNNASAAELLKIHNDLLSEIRELDGERQSLVYNHHHELIAGSDTIRKMKSRADTLDVSLDRLRDAFSTISQLSSSLAPSPSTPKASARTGMPLSPVTDADDGEEEEENEENDNDNDGDGDDDDKSGSPPLTATAAIAPASIPAPPAVNTIAFDPLKHLPPLLSLPLLLRSLLMPPTTTTETDISSTMSISTSSKESEAAARELWGKWEPTIRAWEEAGIKGVEEVGKECRQVLRSKGNASAAAAEA